MSDQPLTFPGCTLNPAWLASETRQEVAEAIGRLNGAAARWAESTALTYRSTEDEFLKYWLDLLGIMSVFTEDYEPPSLVPPLAS